MKKAVFLSCVLFAAFVLNACQTTPISTPVTTGETPIRTSPVNVADKFISVQAIAPQAVDIDQGNLFDNGGFESGLAGWTGCEAGAIAESSDAYDGNKALKVNTGNCFYRSAEVSPGQDLVLSCYVRLQSGDGWTGMGLGFADASWTTIPGGPSTIITGNSYQRYDVKATAPEATKYVSMWMYSDNPVVVDDCSLMLEIEPPPPPPSSSENLLESSGFEQFPLVTPPVLSDWTAGCGGEISIVLNRSGSRKNMVLDNGACLDQSLSASDIAVLKGKDFVYSCLVRNTGDYASMSVFLDGQVYSVQLPSAINNASEVVEVEGSAASSISSGFVSLYAEGTSLLVDECSLTVDGGEPPPPPPSGDNLLDNGNFESVTNLKPNNWTKGCGGTWSSTTANGRGLALSGGACVDQSLSTADTTVLSGQNYVYNCYAKNVSGYASISIFLDGEAQTQAIPVGNSLDLVEIKAQAGQVSSGFVSIYSEGDLVIDDCKLEVEALVGTPSIDVRNNLEGDDSYALSGPYTFEVEVRNNGNLALTNVVLTSDVLDCDTNFLSLAVDEIKTTSCASTETATPTQGFSHTITATATTADGTVVTDSDQSGYRPALRASPRAILNMVTSNRIVAAGSNVKFLISVANAGNVGGISEIESNVADCAKQYSPALVTGDIDVYECVASNVQESFIASANVVMVGAYRAFAQDTINIAIEDSVAVDISVGKEGDYKYGIFGDENPHTFEITVRNIGGVDFASVNLVSDSVADCSRTIGALALGETTSYTCESPLLTSGQILKNIVTATAQSGDGRQATDVDSTEIYPQEDLSLDIRLGNEGNDEITVSSDSDVDITLTVSNTGTVDITEIWEAFIYVTSAPGFEPICQDVTPYAIPSETDRVPFNLAAGETKSFTCRLENVTEAQRVQATFAHLNDRNGQNRDTDVLLIRVVN